MSTFAVPVVCIRAIEPITGADAIELAVIGDYRSVVKKNDFRVGDLAVYIPEAAIVPDLLIEAMGLTGRLHGSQRNRVKAIKLRGCLSQGLLYHVEQAELPYYVSVPIGINNTFTLIDVEEGEDVAHKLGITKYEVPVPAHLSGEVYNAGTEHTVPYDIENFKWYPDVFQDGEEVVFTEKLHGTFTGIGILPESMRAEHHFLGRFVIFSKGLGARGLCFKDVEANDNNVYVNTLAEIDMFSKLDSLADMISADLAGEGGEFDRPLFILGETFGQSVQDLGYGSVQRQFRLFDVCSGTRGNQTFFDYEARESVAKILGIEMVPVLYRGPFSKAVLDQYTNGKETVSGKEAHMREGVVITPVVERQHSKLGRVILKSVSEAYLLRKGKNGQEPTEFN